MSLKSSSDAISAVSSALCGAVSAEETGADGFSAAPVKAQPEANIITAAIKTAAYVFVVGFSASRVMRSRRLRPPLIMVVAVRKNSPRLRGQAHLIIVSP